MRFGFASSLAALAFLFIGRPPRAHTIQNTSEVFYNSKPRKTRTFVIRLQIKRSQCWKLCVPVSFPLKVAIKHVHGESILAILRKGGIWTQLFGSQLCPWNKWNCKAVFYQMPRHWQKAVWPEFHIHSLGAWFKPRNLSSGGKWETARGQLNNDGEGFLSPPQPRKTKWNRSLIDY